MISIKIISDSTISFIRTFIMDFFYHLGDSFIFGFIGWDFSVQPFVICSSAYFSKPAKRSNWIIMLCMFFFNSLINMFISQQAQPRLLSISSSFLRKMPPFQPVFVLLFPALIQPLVFQLLKGYPLACIFHDYLVVPQFL